MTEIENEPEFVRWHLEADERRERLSLKVQTLAMASLLEIKTESSISSSASADNLSTGTPASQSQSQSQQDKDGMLKPLKPLSNSESSSSLSSLGKDRDSPTHHKQLIPAPATSVSTSEESKTGANGKTTTTAAANDKQPLPTLGQALYAVPIQTIPFVFGMFVLVQGLEKGGWIEAFAEGLAQVPGADNPFVSVFWLCFLSTLLCNALNNQPATILMTRVIVHPKYLAALGMRGLSAKDVTGPQGTMAVAGSMYGVILGSNFAAMFTLLGALAGILFAKILSTKNYSLTYSSFANRGFRLMPAVFAAGCLSLWIATAASGRP
jgi:hypothetical protein